MRWSGALAASLVVVVMLMATLQMPTAYATAKGEMRTVPLGDGTTVTLNTDTHIKIYEDEGRRRIRVLRGEVLIEGAGAAVPTLVEVDGKHLEGSAATFVVRKLNDQPAQILVQDGRVVLAEEKQSTMPLSANTGASLLEGKSRAGSCERCLMDNSGASWPGAKERSPSRAKHWRKPWRSMHVTATRPSSSPIQRWRRCRSRGCSQLTMHWASVAPSRMSLTRKCDRKAIESSSPPDIEFVTLNFFFFFFFFFF